MGVTDVFPTRLGGVSAVGSTCHTSGMDSVDYQHIQRGPTWRWWKPLAAIALFLGFLLVVIIPLGVSIFVASLLDGVDIDDTDSFDVWLVGSAWGFFLTMISLAALIPVSIFAMRITFGRPMGYVSSVTGRFRFGWALRCVACVTPVWIALMVVLYFFSSTFDGSQHRSVLLMVAIAVLVVPLQSAGEEFAFRGLLQQTIGSYFSHRWLSLVVPAVVSIPLFAMAHGSWNVWVLADLATFAAIAVYLTWRTGGLEAAIAIHTVNNMALIICGLVFGGYDEGFIDENTTGDWSAPATTLVTGLIATALILWQARRVDVQRQTTPSVPVG